MGRRPGRSRDVRGLNSTQGLRTSTVPPRRFFEEVSPRPIRSCYGSRLMRTVTNEDPISLDELRRLAAGRFGDLVKAVVDLDRGIMIVDADLHADQEAELLAGGSQQRSDWLEFDSMINLLPSFGNRSRGVDDPALRERIARLVVGLVRR